MNIKIDRKLALIDDTLKLLKVDKSKNIFVITAVTDTAVNVKNLYDRFTYTISIEYFIKSIKTFLTDEIAHKKIFGLKQDKRVIVEEPIEEKPAEELPIEPTTEPEDPIEPSGTYVKIAKNPMGKLVFRKVTAKTIYQPNETYEDPYGDLY